MLLRKPQSRPRCIWGSFEGALLPRCCSERKYVSNPHLDHTAPLRCCCERIWTLLLEIWEKTRISLMWLWPVRLVSSWRLTRWFLLPQVPTFSTSWRGTNTTTPWSTRRPHYIRGLLETPHLDTTMPASPSWDVLPGIHFDGLENYCSWPASTVENLEFPFLVWDRRPSHAAVP